jgi:erythritol kinase
MGAICVDAGTTLTKAVGYDERRAEVVVARRRTTVSRPKEDWAEQDMDVVWSSVAEVVRQVAGEMATAIDFVALTAQGDGCWLVDGSGEPTGPAVLWSDGRAAAEVETWKRAGVLHHGFERNGSLTFPGLPNAILTWLRRHDDPRLTDARTALSCGGWLFSRMTGQLGMDESDGSAPFMDVRTRELSPELLRLYDLEWAEALLPRLLRGSDRVAPVTVPSAEGLGLSRGTPVVMAPYDIVTAAMGAGALRSGQACTILGTTLCTEIVTDQARPGERPAGFTIAMESTAGWLRAFPTLSGVGVLSWAARVLGVGSASDVMELAATSHAGADGLLFMPYLSAAGERAPFLDTGARGAFLGLSEVHGRAEMARAVLEGLCFVVAECLDATGVRPTTLHACGGGTASNGWLQLLADVCAVPVVRSADSEVGARGAYLEGLVLTGGARRLEDAAGHVAAGGDIGVRTFEPDEPRRDLYRCLFDTFLGVRDVVATTWPAMAEARAPGRGAVSDTP